MYITQFHVRFRWKYVHSKNFQDNTFQFQSQSGIRINNPSKTAKEVRNIFTDYFKNN